MKTSIPKATLGRLPMYLQYLKSLTVDQIRTISSTTIAKHLSLGEVQVRKDLASVSGRGKPKIGYEINKLISDIENQLGYTGFTNAVLVGAGKLGKALLDYDGFEEYGVKIIAGFDCNDIAIKMGKNTKEILPIAEFSYFCKNNNVKLGIITVGQGSAQQVCDMMIASGIKAILNFAPCTLKVADDVVLRQENLALSLAYLNNQISK